jgi:monothiol glutaredoxin
MSLSEALRDRIGELVRADTVVLFMKGNRFRPACGFSAGVVEALDSLVPRYATVDVLADPELRDGIKEFSEWPTIPQLYVRGEFVGGADIVRELQASGELARLVGAPEVAAPTLHVSPAAAAVFREVAAEAGPEEAIRVRVSPRFEHDLAVEALQPGDLVVETSGVRFVFDPMSAARAEGLRIDYIDRDGEAGFAIDNPGAPKQVQAITPGELQRKLAQGQVRLFDVRTPEEQATAAIAGAALLDEAVRAEILGLDRATPLAFHCHHGIRSQAAAEFFVAQGFVEVYNLRGGIDAWSREVDAAVPRY